MPFCCSVAQSCLTLRPHGLQHANLPCPSPTPEACSNSCSKSQWCRPTISSCHPLLLPSIFPSIRVFSNESVLRIKWPKYWTFSFSISPSAIFPWIFRVDFFQDWLVWSPSCPSDSKESFPAPQFEGVNSLALSLFYCPDLTFPYEY